MNNNGTDNSKQIKKNDKVRDQYGTISTVLDAWDNVITTTNGIYHITKVWKA